jgi:hypothetical protein
MSYENAPATLLLATHCAACGRPLLDAASVTAGMGPDCRKKYLDVAPLDEETRQLANARVYEIAIAVQHGDFAAIAAGIVNLRILNCIVLADRLEEQSAAVRIEETPYGLAVHFRYDERAVAEIRNVPGRRWDPAKKVWTVPLRARPQLWEMVQRCFPGTLGVSSKGPFVIPGKLGEQLRTPPPSNTAAFQIGGRRGWRLAQEVA